MFTGSLQPDTKRDRTKRDIPGHFPPATLIKRSLFCLPHPLLGQEHLPGSFIMVMGLRRDEQTTTHGAFSSPGKRIGRQKCSYPSHQSQLLLQQLQPPSAGCQCQSDDFPCGAPLRMSLLLDTPGRTVPSLSTDHQTPTTGYHHGEISEEFLGNRSYYPCSFLPTSLPQLCCTFCRGGGKTRGWAGRTKRRNRSEYCRIKRHYT